MTAATLTVETTVVVDHEVTVEAGHCELVVDNVREVVVVWLVSVVESDVWVVEEVDSVEEVAELVVEDEVTGGTPHSSRLWPFARVST